MSDVFVIPVGENGDVVIPGEIRAGSLSDFLSPATDVERAQFDRGLAEIEAAERAARVDVDWFLVARTTIPFVTIPPALAFSMASHLEEIARLRSTLRDIAP